MVSVASTYMAKNKNSRAERLFSRLGEKRSHGGGLHLDSTAIGFDRNWPVFVRQWDWRAARSWSVLTVLSEG